MPFLGLLGLYTAYVKAPNTYPVPACHAGAVG